MTEMTQGSPEWHKARLGKITASRFSDVLSKRGNTRSSYMRELLLEKKTGIAKESFSNEAIEWGKRTEPQAREYYEKLCEAKVDQVGFIEHPSIANVGCSPDGLVAMDGSIEIKCPNTSTHLEYIAKNTLPAKYKAQVQGLLWVKDRKWCDFISFDPRVENEPFWHIRVYRDETYINNLANEVKTFIEEMDELEKQQTEIDPQLLIDVTSGGYTEDEWQLKLKDEIRGKVRHGVVCAIINDQNVNELSIELKSMINAWVDFIMTGE